MIDRSRRARALAYLLASLCVLGLHTGCDPLETARGVPESVLEQNNLGTAYLGQQNWSGAETAFLAALEDAAGDPLLLNNLAVARIQQGRIDEALDSLQQAIAADPGHPFGHYNLGLIDKNQGNFDKAVAHFEAVAAFDPDDLNTQYNLGVVYSRLERDEEAEAAFRRAMSRDATHVSTLYGLGRFLMQRGEVEEGQRMITRSQEIRASGLGDVVGTQYGEQGPYALGVDYPGDALAAPAEAAVAFVTGAAAPALTAPADRAWIVSRHEEHGAVWLADGDTVSRLDGGTMTTLRSGAAGRIVALAAGDVDANDTLETAALVVVDDTLRLALGGADGWLSEERFSTAELGAAPVSADLVFVDKDHDGDLDLFACWMGSGGTGCALATNDAAGGFDVRASAEHGFTPPDGSAPVRVTFTDYDNDRDIDLVLAVAEGVRVYANLRDGSFADVAGETGLTDAAPGQGSTAIADLDKNGWMDVIVGGPAGIVPYWNERGRFEAGAAIAADASARFVVVDLDNDGFLDLAASSPEGPRWHRNRGAGEWETRAPFDGDGLDAAAVPLAALDAEGDGDADVAWLSGGNAPLWTTHEGGGDHSWIALDSRGVGDNRYGVGSKVELLAGGLRQKFELTGPAPLLAGLGARTEIQSVRYLWPSGVLQDEVGQPLGQAVEITQLDRKGTSCPLLYAWRDGGWRFVTDFLGGAAVGYQQKPGVFSTPDTDETIKLEGGLTPAADGTLRVRFNNQLEEVLWFDQVELLVVDHPAGTEVFPDERLMPGPPFPAFGLLASNDIRPLAAAKGVESGRDHTAALDRRDRKYVDDFAWLPFKGYADTHTLELDLGDVPHDGRLVLLLDGWIDYADSSANIGAAQAGLELLPPRMWLADGEGWRLSPRRTGFPAGLPKTMAADLTGLLAPGATRVRIETNMRIYWDRARVLVGGETTPLEVTRLSAQGAELRFGGFPRPLRLGGPRVHAYDPQDVDDRGGWKAHAGRYTAFGDVRELLAEIDDRFVTTRGGDEVELRFATPPGPERGWTRSYLLYADGFGKDMDPNSAASDTVGPVPFHAMPGYPYDPGVAGLPLPETATGESDGERAVLSSGREPSGALPQALARRPATRDRDPG